MPDTIPTALDTLNADHILRVYGGTIVPTLDGGIGIELLVQLNTAYTHTSRYTALRFPDGRQLVIEPLTSSPSDTNPVGRRPEDHIATLTVVSDSEAQVE